MPEETRITAKETCITANPLSKENRITADPPSTADPRYTNCLLKEELKPIPLPPLVESLGSTWLSLAIVVFTAVMVFLLADVVGCIAQHQARNEYDREMQKKIDRFVKENQRGTFQRVK